MLIRHYDVLELVISELLMLLTIYSIVSRLARQRHVVSVVPIKVLLDGLPRIRGRWWLSWHHYKRTMRFITRYIGILLLMLLLRWVQVTWIPPLRREQLLLLLFSMGLISSRWSHLEALEHSQIAHDNVDAFAAVGESEEFCEFQEADDVLRDEKFPLSKLLPI